MPIKWKVSKILIGSLRCSKVANTMDMILG